MTPASADRIVTLVRRWAVDWINSHDSSACELILDPDYVLHIGALTLRGRETYVVGTVGQLAIFPGLGLTVHELMSNEDRCAIRFTEHGASLRNGGALAAWTGIALHRWDGHLISETHAQEDYSSRQRQLASGSCAAIEPPAPAPWDTATLASDARNEQAVRDWLLGGGLDQTDAVAFDDLPADQVRANLIDSTRVDIDSLFSAGDAVAFHATAHGVLLDPEYDGPEVTLGQAGLVRVSDGRVVAGHVVRDRLGLRRQATVGSAR